MKLVLPESGVIVPATFMLESNPQDNCGATIRCVCENEKDTKDLFENITKEIMYAIRDNAMKTMNELPKVLTAEIILEKNMIIFTYDNVYHNTLTAKEKKKIMIRLSITKED
jgi:hypothetical protein